VNFDIIKKSPNMTAGRAGWKPDMIVCHIAEGTYLSTVDWLCDHVSEVSAHFVVARDGRIAQLVDIEDTAWSNGTSSSAADVKYCGYSYLHAVRDRRVSANYYTVSIEHEGVYSQTHGELTVQQAAATVQLVKYIRDEVWRIYGVQIPMDREHIVGHCDITPLWKPNCPGERFPYEIIINGFESIGELKYMRMRVGNGSVVAVPSIMLNDFNYAHVRSLVPLLGYKVDYLEDEDIVTFELASSSALNAPG